METKICTGCGRELPATLEYFNRKGRGNNDLRWKCKDCEKAYRAANKEHKQDVDRAYRESHKEELRIKKAEYNRTHKEQLLETWHKWRDRNEGRYLQYQHEYATNRKDGKREYDKQYRKRNLGRIVARQKRWVDENRIHVRSMMRTYASARLARKRNAEGRYTLDDVEKQYKFQKGKCYYCGKKVGKTYHVDHVIPLSRGGSNSPENIVIACPHCNCAKNARLPHEWPEGGRLL
jgi:5-methylcytosine-specific restriction endonuclease McrA